MFDPLINKRVNALRTDQVYDYQRTYDDLLIHPVMIEIAHKTFEACLVVHPQNIILHCPAIKKTWESIRDFEQDIQRVRINRPDISIRIINDAPRKKPTCPALLNAPGTKVTKLKARFAHRNITHLA